MKLSPAQIKALEFLEERQRGWCLLWNWIDVARSSTRRLLELRGLVKVVGFIVGDEERWHTDYDNGIHIPRFINIIAITPEGREALKKSTEGNDHARNREQAEAASGGGRREWLATKDFMADFAPQADKNDSNNTGRIESREERECDDGQ